MIAKRIHHLGVCEHAQTPYARRKCRAARLAAIETAEEAQRMENPRYEVRRGPRRGVWCVIDTHTDRVIMRERDEAMIRRYAEARNSRPEPVTTPVTKPEPVEPSKPAMPAGWSKAAKRRQGRTPRSHPLGEVVESGNGYTVYEDTAFGGGRVQIWDES